MSKFTPTSKANPCPSCGDTKGNCRHQDLDEIILCMTANSSRKGEIAEDGYKVIDFTEDGLWAVLKLDNQEWAQEKKQQWADEQRQRRERSQREEKQKLAQLLSIADRNNQYRRIVAELGLNQKHRISELAERRGLNSNEIDFAVSQGWIASWKPGVKIDASPLLAGVTGGQLTGVVGLAIATVNLNGEITGFQIASDNRVKFGKYLWLSSASRGGNGPHLPSGELPIFLWRHPEAEQITETLLVEGGLKSLITALKLWFRHGRKDIQIIGAAGANWLGSINAVVEGLAQTSKVILCPDAGSLDNGHILSNYKKIVEELTTRAYSVSVAYWDQVEKGKDPDIDELGNTLGFDLITPGEFFSLAGESELKDDSQDWAWRKWLKSRIYTPDIVVNQSKFRFSQIPDNNVIVGVKSGLGTEKTGALIEQIRLSSNRAFLIGYRNNLLLQTGNRASQVGLKIYHLQQDGGIDLVADTNTHLTLCLDSIHHIDGYFNGVDIYLDEAVSVLLHAVTGGTLGEEQGKAIAIFSKALRECNRIFLLDGNLADIHVDFIAKIAGKKVIKIENKAKIPPHNFKFIIGINEDGEIKKRDKSPLIKALLSDDVKPWIASDSKNLTDRLDEILRQSGKCGYVLNKDTSGEPWAKEFLVNPDVFIENHKPDYSIISPTAESGVSVTVKNYFTDKFTFFTGVQGTSSQHQILFRLRDDSITHYVFCPEKSTVRDRNNPKNYSVKAFSKLLDEKIIQSAILAADGNSSSTMLEIIGEAIARSNDDWWQLSCQLGALDNFEMNNLRKCLIHALNEAGHSVEICEWDVDDEAKNKEKAAKEAVTMRYALELYKAIEFNSVEEASKVAKSNPSKEVQRRIEKTWLLDALPGITDLSLWDAEFIADYYLKDKEFISKQRRFYFLQNFEISKKRSEVKWYYMATNQNFFLAQAKGDSHLKVWALQELNILQFLDGEYHRNSPALVNLIKTVRERNDIASALNIMPNPETESKKENIEFLRSLLDSLGIKLAKSVRKLVDGVRERVYCVNDQAMQKPARLEVLSAIARKFDGYLQSETVAKVNWEESPLDPVVEVAATAETAAEITTVVETEITATIQPIAMPVISIASELPDENQQPAEAVIEKLLKITNWAELGLTQSEIDEVWPLFSESQRSHLWQLHHEYQQQLSLEELAQQAIAQESEIKEVGFGSHFRSYVIKAVCDGVAIARRCWGFKDECEIPLSQLLLGHNNHETHRKLIAF
ncbi:MAG: plasmid replication protein, CyRepA1 family [Nostoc sp.]